MSEGVTPTEPIIKLKETLEKEYEIHPAITLTDNTLWIYVPLEKRVVELVATGFGMEIDEKSKGVTAHYINGTYPDRTIDVAYDIGPNRRHRMLGYDFRYPAYIQDVQRNILTSIARAYSDVEEVPGENRYVISVAGDVEKLDHREDITHKKLVQSYVKTDSVPDFFIIILSDIVQGFELRMTISFLDLHRVMQDPTFTEEYTKRAISDQPAGNKDIIGDKVGSHIDYTPLTWGAFIAKQAAYRVQLEYNKLIRDIPKEEKINLLLKSIRNATAAYTFTDFDSILLRNLYSHEKDLFTRDDLSEISPDKIKPKGKLHHIKFF